MHQSSPIHSLLAAIAPGVPAVAGVAAMHRPPGPLGPCVGVRFLITWNGGGSKVGLCSGTFGLIRPCHLFTAYIYTSLNSPNLASFQNNKTTRQTYQIEIPTACPYHIPAFNADNKHNSYVLNNP